MKRTIAAFTILIGLTAIMMGLYLGEFKALSALLGSYTPLFP